MGRGTNSVWERDLATCRALVRTDPDRAAARAAELRETARSEGEKLRAELTIARVELAKGRQRQFRARLERAAARYSSPGPVAKSELAGHWARYHLNERDLESAAQAADLAVSLAEPPASTSPKYGRRYDVTEVIPRTAYAAALIIRAEVRHYQGSPTRALSDVLTALSWVDPRFSPRVHVAGLAALGRVLIEPGIATPKLAHEVLKLCRQAQRILAGRRVKAGHPHRIKLRGLEALAFGVLGSLERAEGLLAKTIQQLQKSKLEDDARVFMEHMVWLVGHRAGQSGRARLLAHRYGLAANEAPKPRKRPKPEDDDEPIGF